MKEAIETHGSLWRQVNSAKGKADPLLWSQFYNGRLLKSDILQHSRLVMAVRQHVMPLPYVITQFRDSGMLAVQVIELSNSLRNSTLSLEAYDAPVLWRLTAGKVHSAEMVLAVDMSAKDMRCHLLAVYAMEDLLLPPHVAALEWPKRINAVLRNVSNLGFGRFVNAGAMKRSLLKELGIEQKRVGLSPAVWKCALTWVEAQHVLDASSIIDGCGLLGAWGARVKSYCVFNKDNEVRKRLLELKEWVSATEETPHDWELPETSQKGWDTAIVAAEPADVPSLLHTLAALNTRAEEVTVLLVPLHAEGAEAFVEAVYEAIERSAVLEFVDIANVEMQHRRSKTLMPLMFARLHHHSQVTEPATKRQRIDDKSEPDFLQRYARLPFTIKIPGVQEVIQ